MNSTTIATELPQQTPLLLIQDEHPFLGIPVLTIHPCGLEERLSLLVQLSVSDSPQLSLLRWFGLIGPLLGFQVTPHFFTEATKILLCSSSSPHSLEDSDGDLGEREQTLGEEERQATEIGHDAERG
jgi:hypothetical protein